MIGLKSAKVHPCTLANLVYKGIGHGAQHSVGASHEYVLGLRHIFDSAVATSKTSPTPGTLHNTA
jgi:hypothetical protein